MEEKLKLVQAKDLTPGTKIWITVTDPKQKTETKFVPAEVIKVLGTKDQVHVKFEDGSRNSMDAEDFNTFNISTISLRSEKVVPVEDLVLMKYINDPEIGATLKSRFNSDEVYTYCGSTMVSINPYCLFQGEYSVKKKLEYKEHLKNSFFIMQKIPPHIYSMALSSVHEIIYDDTPASKLSICLGGESGSGKTEAALYCLDFIVFCYKENPEPGSIESRIINGHTILSVFGNAKTMHNDNSSRFSKYINMMIDGEEHKILGYQTKCYMLEKGRLVYAGPDERKFHIFYALQKTLTPEQKSVYMFKANFADYEYLKDSINVACSNDDEKCFMEFFRVIELFGYQQEEIEGVLTLMSIILMFGNVHFKKQDENEPTPKLDDTPDLRTLLSLMKISKEELEHTFSQKVIGKGAANEAGFKVLTTADCIVRKEVLTKCLYESLFYWFVHRQKDLEVIDPKGQYETIGILDISGFEMLSTNSLEQLLINYMNERAQKMFTSSYFDEEKALFEKEGLSKYILDFRPSSNEEVMRVIDNPKGQHKGAFQALEDALKSFRGDASFLVNLVEAQKNSPLFSKSLKKNDRFTIYHSCYPVEYTVKDFVEKIKDELPSNLLALMSKSNPIVGKILEETLKLALDNNKMINLCESFKRGINELMEDLEKSRCNFVRCIKPNNSKAAGVWDMPLVMNQIKFLGIKDFLIMKKKMFPLRIDYKEFCKKYLEINTSINEMYYELEAKPYTNFKEIALETYKKVNKDPKDSDLIFGKKRVFANYSTFEKMDEELSKTFAKLESKRALVMRLFEKYWLRKNWRVFSANLRKTMEIARSLMRSWLYRTKDYQAYKRTLKLVRMLQYDFRYRKLRRLHRIDMARKEFERSVARTFLDRYRYLKLKKASLVIQRNYVIAKFKKLVHGRIAVRQLLLEEYKTTVWPGIIQLLQSKSCQIIQDNFRGYLARTKHANEVSKLEDFKKNWKRHQASARISAFFKACYVRQKMKKITQASIKIQRKWRKKILLRAQNTVIKAARVIQKFMRKILFKRARFAQLLKEKLETGEFSKWQDLALKELATVYSINFVPTIKSSDRLNKLNKQTALMTYIPETKPYMLKKLKVYSYILDIDPIMDPKDTYNQLWSIPFLGFMRRAREEYGGNLFALTVGEAHTYAVTDNCKVYQWGASSVNQLGFFMSFHKTLPIESDLLVKPASANYLLAGNNHTVMWSSAQGRLYSWGDNTYGQLGLGHYSSIKGIVDISHLTKGKQVRQLEVRSDLNAIVLEDGTATVWPFDFKGKSDPSPVPIKLLNQKIGSVSCGMDFIIFCTEIGQLYSMGKTNSCGELGVGDFNPRFEPTLISSLSVSGDIAQQVSCGLKHVIMRNQNGKVFTWGWGERGQLGHESDKNLSTPKKVLFRASGGYSYHAMNIQAGYRSSYAILEERRIFHWGTNGRIVKVKTPTEYLDSGNDEIYFKRNDFRPLKICTTWSKSMSVTYVVLGDVRYLDQMKYSEREVLLRNINTQWEKNYYDLKPQFDKKVGVHLDSNMMGFAEKALEMKKLGMNKENPMATTMERDAGRSKTPPPPIAPPASVAKSSNLTEVLKKKAMEEEKTRLEEQSMNKQNVMKHIGMLDEKMKAAEKNIMKEMARESSRGKKNTARTGKSSNVNRETSKSKDIKSGRREDAKYSGRPDSSANNTEYSKSHTNKSRTPPPGKRNNEDAELKEKYKNVEKEMKKILAKDPRDWTAKEEKFIKEAKKIFGKG